MKNIKSSKTNRTAQRKTAQTKTAAQVAATVRLSRFREDPDNVSEATDEEIARLAGKLKRVPLGLTAMRIAYVTDAPGGGCMVISGNKRLRVLKQAYGEDGEVPAEWFADVTAMSEAERHEFRLNANISDGHWNLDKLLDQYGRDELSAAGLDNLLESVAQDSDEYGTDFSLKEGEKERYGEMNFVVTEDQRERINYAVSIAVYCDEFDCADNANKNGAALSCIVCEWLAGKVKSERSYTEVERDYKHLREQLCAALKSSGRKSSEVDALLGTCGMAGHYFGESQWMFPTREAFEKMKTIMPALADMDYEHSKVLEREYHRMEMLRKNRQSKGDV